MKTLKHPHRTSFLRALLLMTVLAALKPAATIKTVAPEENGHLNLASEVSQMQSFQTDGRLNFTTKATPMTFSSQERKENIRNTTLATTKNSWTTPRTRLTGEPSAPERGTATEFFVTNTTEDRTTLPKEWNESAVSILPNKILEKSLLTSVLYNNNTLQTSDSSSESFQTRLTSPQTISSEKNIARIKGTPMSIIKGNDIVPTQGKITETLTSSPERTKFIKWSIPTMNAQLTATDSKTSAIHQTSSIANVMSETSTIVANSEELRSTKSILNNLVNGKESESTTLETRIPNILENNNSRALNSNQSPFSITLDSRKSGSPNEIPLNLKSVGTGSISKLAKDSITETVTVALTNTISFESTSANTDKISTETTASTNTTPLQTTQAKTDIVSTAANTIPLAITSTVRQPTNTAILESTSSNTDITSTVTVTLTNTTPIESRSVDRDMTITEMIATKNTTPSPSENTGKTSNMTESSFNTVSSVIKDRTLRILMASGKTIPLESKSAKGITITATIPPINIRPLESIPRKTDITSTGTLASTNTTPLESTSAKTVKTSTVHKESTKNTPLELTSANTNEKLKHQQVPSTIESTSEKTNITSTVTTASTKTNTIELKSSNAGKTYTETANTDKISTETVSSTNTTPLEITQAKMDLASTVTVASTNNTPLKPTSANPDKISTETVASTKTTPLELTPVKTDMTFTVTVAPTNTTPLESTARKTDMTSQATVASTNTTPLEPTSTKTDIASTVTVASTNTTPLESTSTKTDMTSTVNVAPTNTTTLESTKTDMTSPGTVAQTNITPLESTATKTDMTSQGTVASTNTTPLESTSTKTDMTSTVTVAPTKTTTLESTKAVLKSQATVASTNTTPLESTSTKTHMTSTVTVASKNNTTLESAKMDMASTVAIASTNTTTVESTSIKTDLMSTVNITSTNITPLDLTLAKIEKTPTEIVTLTNTTTNTERTTAVNKASTQTIPLESTLTNPHTIPILTISNNKSLESTPRGSLLSQKLSPLNADLLSNRTNLDSSHTNLRSILTNTESSQKNFTPSGSTPRETTTTENSKSISSVTSGLSKNLESQKITKEYSLEEASELSKTTMKPSDKTTKAISIPSNIIFQVMTTSSPSVFKTSVNYDSFTMITEPSDSYPEATPQVTLKSTTIFTKSTDKSLEFTTPATKDYKLEKSKETSDTSAGLKLNSTISKLNTFEPTRKSIFKEPTKKRPDQLHTITEKNKSTHSLVPTKWTTLKGKSVQMIFLSNANESKEISPVEINKDTIRIRAKPTLLLRTKEKQTQIQRNFPSNENTSTKSYISKNSQDKTLEVSEISTKPTKLFQSNYERYSTEWPISKRKKIKEQNHDLLHKTTEDFAFINQESKKTGKNSTFTPIIKSDNSIVTTISPVDTLQEFTTKNQWYLLNFSNKERKNNQTKLALPKGELIYHRKSTTESTKRIDYSTNTNINMQSKPFKANKITDKKIGKSIPKTYSPARNFKTNKTIESDPANIGKGVSENKSIYRSKSVEKNQNGYKKTSVVNKNENKGEINRIEEILLNYYEAFKKRNTTNNHVQKNNKKSVPVKRKFKIKKRPVTNNTKENGMPLCIKPTVVNRRYLNSSYMLLIYILKEHFINYRSLEYLDLSHNAIRRFNLSTLNNLNTLKYVSLESNNLTDLYPINFYTLRNLEYLDLSNNYISKIRNFTFTNMKSLKYLNLNANNISKINATTLRGLQGLTHLDLSSNIIEYIHEDSLPKILSIKYLNLSSNKISTLAIKNIKNIQTVDLSHNEIDSLSNITLGDLTNQMKVLKLNNNLLEHLDENIFINFTKLIYLDVSNNKLNYISPSTFQYFNNLIFLNISGQNILSMDKMKDFTYSIAKSNDVFRNDENSSIAPFNTILKNKTTTKKKNKNYYYESFTKTKGKSNDSEFINNYQKVIKGNLSAINTNQNGNFSKNEELKESNLKESKQTLNNRIMKRTNLFHKNKAKTIASEFNLGRIKENKNKTQKGVKTNINNLSNINYFKLISNLRNTNYFKLDLLASISQRLKHFECTDLNLNQVPKVLTHSIQILNLKLNKIKMLKLGDLDDYPLLQILILSQNKIRSIETDSLGRLDYLRILLVDKNKLKSIPISLPENIKILNLNLNIISRIKQEDFFDLVNLEELYLQGNKIEYISPNTFTFLNNLKRLDMSNNPIRTINSIVLPKLNFINLSNLKQIQSNYSDRFPVEDGYSLIGVKLSNSDELCRLLLDDYAFVLTLKQIKYLNCDQTESDEESDLQEKNQRRNETCEPSIVQQEHTTQTVNTRGPKSSVTNRSRVNFISSRKIINIDQTKGCVNNESDVSQIINSNMVRKRSNKAYSKTINTNLNVNNNILLNVNKCTICKVDRIYEPLFEFDFANVESYIENIISFANVLNYTNTRSYLKHAMEEQQGNCLQSNNSRGGYARRTYDIENYTPMNNSTDVLTFPMRNNRSSFANKRKTSRNRMFSKSNTENEGISVITKDTDISSTDFFPVEDKSSRYYSSVTYKDKHRYLQNMDFELSDQASVLENSTNDVIKMNEKQNYKKREESNKPPGEENKFSIVKDNKKNVILKLNRNMNNETEDKQTKNYDQLETEESSKTTNNKENEKHKVVDFEGNLIKDDKKFTIGKEGNIIIQPSEYYTKRPEEIKYGRMVDDRKIVLESSHDTVYRALKSDQSVKKSNQSEQISNKRIEEYKIGDDGKNITKNTNNYHNQIDQILSYVKNYPLNRKEFEIQGQTKNDPNNERETNKQELFSTNLNSHKDAQYEMNIVDTDAEFLDIIDDKTEKIINENTVRTLETSKYHELVSQNTLEGMHYHTGMIIFLMIVVLMIVAAFLALTFQWNTLLHYYCHNYVSYRNNGHSDDEEHSDSNFDRIEMLDNSDVYSIT